MEDRARGMQIKRIPREEWSKLQISKSKLYTHWNEDPGREIYFIKERENCITVQPKRENWTSNRRQRDIGKKKLNEALLKAERKMHSQTKTKLKAQKAELWSSPRN